MIIIVVIITAFPSGPAYSADAEHILKDMYQWSNTVRRDSCEDKSRNNANKVYAVTVRLTKTAFCLNNHDGILFTYQNRCLYKFAKIYVGLNQNVIQNTGIIQTGQGLCSLCAYWGRNDDIRNWIIKQK